MLVVLQLVGSPSLQKRRLEPLLRAVLCGDTLLKAKAWNVLGLAVAYDMTDGVAAQPPPQFTEGSHPDAPQSSG